MIAAFKMGASEHMEDLVKNGRVYMNTASFFATLEGTEPGHDPNEGASYCEQTTGAVLSVAVKGEFKELGTVNGRSFTRLMI